jgi:hypothetical protein
LDADCSPALNNRSTNAHSRPKAPAEGPAKQTTSQATTRLTTAPVNTSSASFSEVRS